MEYVRQLEAIRRAFGYTQAEMARLCGLTPPEYSRLLRGQRNLGVLPLSRIIRTFPIMEKATWDYIRRAADSAPEAATANAVTRTGSRESYDTKEPELEAI